MNIDPIEAGLKGASSLNSMYAGNKQAKELADIQRKNQEIQRQQLDQENARQAQRAPYRDLLAQSFANPYGSSENQGLLSMYGQQAQRAAAAQGRRGNPIHAATTLHQQMLPQLNAQRAQLANVGFGGQYADNSTANNYNFNQQKTIGDLSRNANAQPLAALGDLFTKQQDPYALLGRTLLGKVGQ